ncbi:hypothetical protein K435DRAFT_853897 [Dendrothele bispora CBS 962.96]|uniref:CxC2-like cysteine cluster KDZ transposase-associated domain-containing protein n=1 Tax=Dendrothele bispora (strain CBS 962.96) TaxID=1314807 RepID=A0A4S8MGK4_DENBC|nr:hypothetical protein K435DRAFT_853897 [Dendrothele bispora CBS 962.96]
MNPMGSGQPPKKKFKTDLKNPASHITSYGDLGLSFTEPTDILIIHHTSSSTYRGQDHKTTSIAPTLQERVYTSIIPNEDWVDFEQEDPSWKTADPGQFVFQVKNGRVSKVRRKKLFASDRPMRTFVHHRDKYLEVLMCLKGRGDQTPEVVQSCPTCPPDRVPILPTLRCLDCFHSSLVCQDCCIASHRANPLHHIQSWNGKFFERVSLRRLGLVVQLGHLDGSECDNPLRGPSKFMVVHTNGVHRVELNYCGCTNSISTLSGSQHQKWEQLMRARWFPATHTRPQTACTFQMLQQFHILTLCGKITAFDYYRGIERLTDNTGKKLPKRYPTCLRVIRQWRHLRMLRRGGRGNDGDRNISQTRPGELAVKCIACPRPDVNLPQGWDTAPGEIAFIYTMFLSFDACFRLKRKRISNWKKDPSLQDGWAYFVENGPYLDWCRRMEKQTEMCTCTGLAALDHANTKFNQGYDETGKGGGTCPRHEMLWANAMGALRVGERYANMDYIMASWLRHIHIFLVLILCYDIVCQWSKKLIERLKNLPPLVRLNVTLRILYFVIPKLHILGHLVSCQTKFSLNYTTGAGQTDAEGIERIWSGLGGVATSLKEMGPGSHHDTLEDHIGHWNWSKVHGLGQLLKKRLLNAVSEYQDQFESWCDFSKKQASNAMEWKQMVDDYENQRSDFNPFEFPINGKTLQTVRLDLAKEAQEKMLKEMREEERLERLVDDDKEEDKLPDQDTSLGEFLYLGLEIEQQQRDLRQDIQAIRSPTNKQLIQIVDRRTKLGRQITRFRTLQLGYTLVALQILSMLPTSQIQVHSEEIPLYLPSMLISAQRRSELCRSEVTEMEIQFRDAQLNESLNLLRNSILVKQRLLRYKKTNARHQGPNTRSRTHINRQDKKIQRAAATYRAAWNAKLALHDGKLELMEWNKLLDEHIIGMEDLQVSQQKKVKAAKGKRAAASSRASRGENPVEGAREKHRKPSWIWYGVSDGELGADKYLYEGLRIEWCKSYARVKRWREEVMLLQEEMRRCLVTLEWEAVTWEKRANIPNFDGERLEGAGAYAHEQAHIRRDIAQRFTTLWSTETVKACRDFNPGSLELTKLFRGVPEVKTMDVEEDSGDDTDDSMQGLEQLDVEKLSEEEEQDDQDEEEIEDEIENDKEEGRLEEEASGSDISDYNMSDDDGKENLTLKEMLLTLEEENRL